MVEVGTQKVIKKNTSKKCQLLRTWLCLYYHVHKSRDNPTLLELKAKILQKYALTYACNIKKCFIKSITNVIYCGDILLVCGTYVCFVDLAAYMKCAVFLSHILPLVIKCKVIKVSHSRLE